VLCKKDIIRLQETWSLKLSKMTSFFIKIFLLLYIPITIAMVAFSIINVFAHPAHPVPLLYVTIIAVIAFILERVIEKTQLAMELPIKSEDIITNKAVFAYIDLHHEIERINRNLIEQISNTQTGLVKQFESAYKKYNLVGKHINEYVQLQIKECKKLLEERNKLEQFISDLESKVEQFSIIFAQYANKLNNSSKSILYYEKGAFLIEDINESFVSKYKQTSNETIKHLEDTEKQLRKVVEQYSRFKEHFRPLNEKVDIYGSRMESAVQSLRESSESKKAVLEDTSNKIVNALEELNNNVVKTLNYTDHYLKKNSFVLSKILETYKINATTPGELKKMIQSWQTFSFVNVEKE
jgi:methyl-accepting chemotaxis protein